MRQVPVAYLVFDVLYAGGELLLERPLREREKILDALLAAPRNAQAGPRVAAGPEPVSNSAATSANRTRA